MLTHVNGRSVPYQLPGNKPGFSVRELPDKYQRRAMMPSKLYVGNLACAVSNDDLQQLFSQVGQVQSVAIITDKFSGQSKGFGFVEMANAEDASKAIQTLNDTDLKGRNIKVSEAKPRESSFGGGGGGNRRDGGDNRGGGGGGRW